MAAPLDPDMARIDIGTMLSEVWRRKWQIAGITIGLLALTYITLMFVPKMYESSASILVEPRDTTFLRASTDAGSGGGAVGDDMAIASQVELIQSRDTLLSVIDSAHLRDVPELATPSTGLVGKIMALFGRKPAAPKDVTDTVLANIIDRLTVVRERDSRVISVLFRAENPVLAAKVANAIANAHVSRRAGLEIQDTADATKWLGTEIDKMRKKVAEADAKVANFRIAHDLYNGKDGNSSLIDQQLSDIATQITDSQQRENTARSRAGVLRTLIQAGKPIDSVPTMQDSAVIQALAQQKSELQGKKAELLARLLPNHPDVLAVSAQISEINKQMASEGRRIADALDAEADIEAKIRASLRQQLTEMKATASTDLTNGVTLAEIEREAKAQRDLLETYLVRYRDASARTDVNSALPDVRVVTAAAPSFEPASPKTTLILIAVLVVSLAGQIGYVLFGELASGRAIVTEADARQEPAQSETAPVPDEIEDDAMAVPPMPVGTALEPDYAEEMPMPDEAEEPLEEAPAEPLAEPPMPAEVAALEPDFIEEMPLPDEAEAPLEETPTRPLASDMTEPEPEPESTAPAGRPKIVSRFADLLKLVSRAKSTPSPIPEPDMASEFEPAPEPEEAVEAMAASEPVTETAPVTGPEPEPAMVPESVLRPRSNWSPPPEWIARLAAIGIKSDQAGVTRTEAPTPQAEAAVAQAEVPAPPAEISVPRAEAPMAESEAPVAQPATADTPADEIDETVAAIPDEAETEEAAADSAEEMRPAPAPDSAPTPEPAATADAEATATPAMAASLRQTEYVPRRPGISAAERPQAKRLPDALRPLVHAISSGRERIVLVSGFGDPAFASGVIEQLGGACAALGLGVATIDAASGRQSANAGISDLLIGAASFGDVVHADRGGHLARVPWGRQAKLDARSSQGMTLAEALSDIYNVVLIATGQPGPASSLPVFAGLDGYVVLASAHAVDAGAFAGFEAGVGALGFKRVQIVSAEGGDEQVA